VEWDWVLVMSITAVENNMVCGPTVETVCIQDVAWVCFSKQNDLDEPNCIFITLDSHVLMRK
jgi:hypothetical protein